MHEIKYTTTIETNVSIGIFTDVDGDGATD